MIFGCTFCFPFPVFCFLLFVFLLYYIYFFFRKQQEIKGKQNTKMPSEVSVRLVYLKQANGIEISEIIKRFLKYSKPSIYIHAKLPDEFEKQTTENLIK